MGRHRPAGIGATLPALTYLAYTGSLVAVTVIVTILNRIRLGEHGWSFTWQLVAIALVTALFATVSIARATLPVDEFFASTKVRARAELEQQHDRFEPRQLWSWCIAVLLALRDVRVRISASLDSSDSGVLSSTDFGTGTLWSSLEAAAYMVTGLVLLAIDHRLFVVAIALFQISAIRALRARVAPPSRLVLAITCIASWALASGMTYTRIGDWLLNGSLSSNLAVVAFLMSFTIVLAELCSDDPHYSGIRTRWIPIAVAIGVFAAYALRTDNFTANWVPFHRSYFADTSDFVRNGHWLLWDVPSAYGFLSILILATMPAANGWQATYELTALFLTAQCLIVFAILRWGRGGFGNALFAILFPMATMLNDGISRYAWSGRLYPQGGLRFFWIDCLVFVVFLMNVWRGSPKRMTQLRWLGHVLWLIAVFWSIENALWVTVLWVAYLAADVLTYPEPVGSVATFLSRALRRVWPLFALPAGMVAAIEVIYHAALGVGPDWMSFVEFSGAFANGQIRPIFHVQYLGASWIFLLVLGAIGALSLYAIHVRRWDMCRLLAATWFAVWGSSTYFALEPLDMYVTLLLAVLAPAIAILTYCSRDLGGDTVPFMTRVSIAPIAIITIALLLGGPSRMAALTLPFTPNWHADVTQDFPPISGELQQLMQSAGIHPGDAVLFPHGKYWTELSQGMILQFARDESGRIVEYRSWLPISPVGPGNVFDGLAKERQRLYIDRFLARSTSAGWYITYRGPADCGAISSRLTTLERYRSVNFSASRCALR